MKVLCKDRFYVRPLVGRLYETPGDTRYVNSGRRRTVVKGNKADEPFAEGADSSLLVFTDWAREAGDLIGITPMGMHKCTCNRTNFCLLINCVVTSMENSTSDCRQPTKKRKIYMSVRSMQCSRGITGTR